MKIFGISDLHLDSQKDKPMDIFGDNWIDHDLKIFENWQNTVRENDLVLLPGDISWAISLEAALKDLELIDKLNGTKIISKGNHDYWWTSMKKMNSLNLKTIHFLYNNHYEFNNIIVYGTRGWISKDNEEYREEDNLIYQRELNRLENSFLSAKDKDPAIKISLIHFPPFDIMGQLDDFGKLISKNNIDYCLYGHLHGKEGFKYVKEGIFDNTKYSCVSADFINFQLIEILEV